MSNLEDKQHDKKQAEVEVDEVTNVKLIGGHEFDGIRELENPLPPWLKYLFYASLVFSAAYLILLFVFKDESLIQDMEYQNEMAEAIGEVEEESSGENKEAVAVVRTEEDIMASGKNTYTKICSVCHGKFGEGLVGPNFTDEYWIHGGSREDMHQIIINGVIEKGMISYQNQLSETQIQDVITYIQSLKGTNPQNQKAAEGEKYIPESEPENVEAEEAAS
ncbi:cbb3-type cytochrome c oxidase N-terminal domain-containing protein [Sunxiuqinia sp. A32]|uniref:cbb3-type cytochrome c oxidase N-terminal domain-containing protein n=1 Tax=Sunxiuqinia sp. A32 TaxID=3461496 RepID=UPI0040455C42